MISLMGATSMTRVRARFSGSRGLPGSQNTGKRAGEAWFAAKLVAAMAEDCGPCTQLVVTMAEREGVSPPILARNFGRRTRGLAPDAALGFRFARAVIERDVAGGNRLRDEVVSRWGRKGLVSLALTIAASRIFSTVKYALGHGHACVRVRVAGADTQVSRQESAV